MPAMSEAAAARSAGAPIGPLERGSALHRALELYKQRFPGAPPEDALAQLIAIADEVFAELAIPQAALRCGGRAF